MITQRVVDNLVQVSAFSESENAEEGQLSGIQWWPLTPGHSNESTAQNQGTQLAQPWAELPTPHPSPAGALMAAPILSALFQNDAPKQN